jgi:hypothetical protein
MSAGHIGEMRKPCKFWSGSIEGRDHVGVLDVDVRIMLKLILK